MKATLSTNKFNQNTSKDAAQYQQEILRRMRLVLGENGVPPDSPASPPPNTVARVAVISDIHSNDEALRAVLAHAGNIDQLWCLGDILGYGPHPRQTVAMLRAIQSRGMLKVIGGNHDHAVCGHEKISKFNDTAKDSVYKNFEDSTPDDIEWLNNLPLHLSVGLGKSDGIVLPRFSLGHGSIADTDMYRPMDEDGTKKELAALDNLHLPGRPLHSLIGHTHIPAISVVIPTGSGRVQFHRGIITPERFVVIPKPKATVTDSVRAVINPGSVGQPRDEDPRASYMTLDFLKNGDTAVTHHKVRYDAEPIIEALEKKGYPEFNRTRILIGH